MGFARIQGRTGAGGCAGALGSRDAPGLGDVAGLMAVLGSKDVQGWDAPGTKDVLGSRDVLGLRDVLEVLPVGVGGNGWDQPGSFLPLPGLEVHAPGPQLRAGSQAGWGTDPRGLSPPAGTPMLAFPRGSVGGQSCPSVGAGKLLGEGKMDSHVCVMWRAAVAARERETEAEGGELLVNQGGIGRAGTRAARLPLPCPLGPPG